MLYKYVFDANTGPINIKTPKVEKFSKISRLYSQSHRISKWLSLGHHAVC